MAGLNVFLQERVRQFLDLRGMGVSVQGIESVQPVVLLGGFPIERQPQYEKGPAVVRRWVGFHNVGAVALNYALIHLRPVAGQILHIQKVRVTSATAGNTPMSIGRTGVITAATWGHSHYTNQRLLFTDIGVSLVEIIGANQVAFPTFYGYHLIWVPQYGNQPIDVDYILVHPADGGADLGGLTVCTGIVNAELSVSFEGVAYDVA